MRNELNANFDILPNEASYVNRLLSIPQTLLANPRLFAPSHSFCFLFLNYSSPSAFPALHIFL